MFLHIESLLTAAEIQSVMELARRTRFVGDAPTAPHNTTRPPLRQDPADPSGQQAAQIVLAAMRRSDEARDFVWPRRIAVPQFVRCTPEMTYGARVDAAYMAVSAPPLRADVSCTIFISDPAAYQGGELTLHLGTESVRIKGKAGGAVFYPSTTLHEVAPIRSGERWVMVAFVESQIPDPAQRDLLYTLNEVRALEGLKMEWDNRMRLESVIANLLRMWVR